VPCSVLFPRAGISRVSKPMITSFASASASATSGIPGRLPGTGQYARALARLAGRATGTGPARLPDERTLLDLVAVLAAGRDTARATAHRAAAHCYIEEHLTSPGLGADQIAAAIGISDRQLSRVFSADGTSVPRHILARRLQLAYSVLAAVPPVKGGAGETVADTAARCGFTSSAYFSHAFRQHFGLRASELASHFRHASPQSLALPRREGTITGKRKT
jgi:AraC-like DNA-binding protein